MPLAHEFAATTTEPAPDPRPGATELKRDQVAHGVIRGSEVILDLPLAKTGKLRLTSLTALKFGNVLVRMRTSYPAVDTDERTAQIWPLTRPLLAPPTRL
tara:strand:- start:100 stop:399 length:300 start_codon:yes stop_codon:yes gene_type:complete